MASLDFSLRLFTSLLVLSLSFAATAQASDEETQQESANEDTFAIQLTDPGEEQSAQGTIYDYRPPPPKPLIPRGETVTTRQRPELDPLGIRMGSFLLYPSVGLEQRYNDNIFATENDEEDDFITRITPQINLVSDWNNHELSITSGAAIGRYWDNTDEDYDDYNVGVSGRIDVLRTTAIRAGLLYEHLHEDRSSPDDAGGSEPTEFDAYSGRLGLSHDFGRINAEVGGSALRLEYETPSGALFSEEERDRNKYEGNLRLGYEIVPEYEAFIRASYNIIDYDENCCNATPLDRDSEGFFLGAGVALDLGGILFGDLFAGYRYQDYDDSALDTVDGFGGGGQLTWNVTPLTTVVGTLRGDVLETTVSQGGNSASGALDANGTIRVDHELLRNLIIGGDFSASRIDYEGINRVDWRYTAGADVTYMMNRHVYLVADYQFDTRDAEQSVNDFTENVVFLRLDFQY